MGGRGLQNNTWYGTPMANLDTSTNQSSSRIPSGDGGQKINELLEQSMSKLADDIDKKLDIANQQQLSKFDEISNTLTETTNKIQTQSSPLPTFQPTSKIDLTPITTQMNELKQL